MKRPFLLILVAALVACGTRQEDKYLSFLYSYMPLPDSVDHPREYWAEHVRVSLEARRTMPWGKRVPEREWRHFVLPARVNNEDLDTARVAFYHLLRERVSGLSMHDAVLEVNHWCHEHVTYQPADSRTSSPLATMRSTIGRCGEESTFCVAALRAVGIPARQVYTPRWAHTDDNHAWVEAWVDGQWHFLGACEPEAVLDKGWFNQPASRGMMMHTKVFGRYDGPEEVVSRNACYTEINVTHNYAPVARLAVRVTDREGQPVEDATVQFRLYNEGEFYALASQQTDAQGRASMSFGLGSLLVWAHRDGRFGFCHASVGKDEEVTVRLAERSEFSEYSDTLFDFDLVPPDGHDNLPPVTDAEEALNRQRLAYEDSLRQAYADTAFYQGDDDARLVGARANWRTIERFLTVYPDAEQVLGSLSQKDLRDVRYDVLADFAASGAPVRVANELLTPWFTPLNAQFSGMEVADVLRWVADSIRVDDSRNPQSLCMSPEGVLRHRITDAHSRDIFLVCALRAAGHKAWIDRVAGGVMAEGRSVAEYAAETDTAAAAPQTGTLVLDASESAVRLAYYTNFTLSRLTDEGSLQLLNYGSFEPFTKGVAVPAGRYLLVSGQRLASGGVLSRMRFFSVAEGETTVVPLIVRQDEERVQVIGSFDSESRYLPWGEQSVRSLLSETGRGYFVVGLLRPGHEPSNHALCDLAAASAELEEWGRPIVLIAPRGTDIDAMLSGLECKGRLPSTMRFGTDETEQLFAGSQTLPRIMIADTFNRVVFRSEGYTIGLGQKLAAVAAKL